MPSNLERIDLFLKGLGLSPVQRAGVEGNLKVESNFNPAASNPREGAIGIAQWEGGRRTQLQNFARQSGKPETDLDLQLSYLGWELQGPEHNAMVKLQQANSAAAAAAAFDQYYERSAGTSRQQRIDAANTIASGNIGVTDVLSDPVGSISGAFGGVFDGWQSGLVSIGLKVLAGTAAAALVIAGAWSAVHDDKGN